MRARHIVIIAAWAISLELLNQIDFLVQFVLDLGGEIAPLRLQTLIDAHANSRSFRHPSCVGRAPLALTAAFSAHLFLLFGRCSFIILDLKLVTLILLINERVVNRHFLLDLFLRRHDHVVVVLHLAES